MMLKRCLLMLLAVFLIMGCVGAVSAIEGDDTPIETVTISVDAPTTGGTPDTSPLTSGNAEGTITWSQSPTTFAPGTAYTATILVTASNGYNFTNPAVTFNGEIVVATILTNKTLRVSHTFAATADTTLDTKISLTLAAPKTGERPGIPSSITAGVGTPSITWSPSATTFNANTTYTVIISVPAKNGYEFPTSQTVEVNGHNVDAENIIVADDKKSLTAEYTFPDKTITLKIPSVAIILPEPVTGNIKTSPTSPTTGVGTPTAIWSPTVTAFIEGQIYSANITIPVTSTNYEFESSPKVTLNGVDFSSEIVSYDKTQIILNHTFGETALKKRIDSVTITGVTAPAYGTKPVTSAASSTSGINSVTVSWTPSVSSTFAAGTTYTATIVAQITSSSYAFNTSTPSVSLNGATASTANVTRDSDTQLTITYTFPKTESKILPTITLSTNITNNIGTVPLSVKFYYTLSSFDNCTLTYGDGFSSALTSSSGDITHTYTTVGTYNAKLTATNINGTKSSEPIVITVNKIGLAASFTASSESGTAPMNVLFVDTSAGSPTQWIWDFGGQGSSMLQNPSFTFTKAGTYIVKLSVIDSAGATNSYSKFIYVNAPAATTTPTVIQTNALTTTSLSTAPMGEVVVPAPLDIIKEFVRLFYSLFNPASYLFF